jgi:hypothetical protein
VNGAERHVDPEYESFGSALHFEISEEKAVVTEQNNIRPPTVLKVAILVPNYPKHGSRRVGLGQCFAWRLRRGYRRTGWFLAIRRRRESEQKHARQQGSDQQNFTAGLIQIFIPASHAFLVLRPMFQGQRRLDFWAGRPLCFSPVSPRWPFEFYGGIEPSPA